MNRFESITKPLVWFMALLLVVFVAGCSNGGSDPILGGSNGTTLSSTKAITAYSLNGATGTINEAAKTIAVTVPSTTNLTALVATFTTTGTSVKVGAAVQTSGTTANDFTASVAYIVTAGDGSTVTYTVTATKASTTAKAMTAYTLAGATGTINEVAKTIAVTVPSGTTVTALVATFTTTGTSVKVGATAQTSATTANDFTAPVAYIVTAGDLSTATYTVTVTVASTTAKAMTAYSFAGYTGAAGTINEVAKTIAVTVPNGTNVTALVATFTTTGTGVTVGTPAVMQTSTATANNFTSPVDYIVTAADGSTAIYTVTVTVAANSAKAMTAYSFAGYIGAAGTINEAAKTIAVTVPNGTSFTALVATFTTTGASVKVGTVTQTSTATANDFTTPKAYIVTATDGSTAIYTVTVTVASATAKAITAYSFAGYAGATGTINEAAKTIAVTVPSATNLAALVATFTTTGTGVTVGTPAVTQVSGTTPNDFTNSTHSVAYIVTAGDGSTVTYTVTVTAAPAITAYSLNGFAGVISEATTPRTIAVTVPFGTPVTALVATYTTTGTLVTVGAPAVTQVSGTTANDFTAPVVYTVTAGSLTATYNVTVTLGVALGKAATFGMAATAGVTNTVTTPITHINGDVVLTDPSPTCNAVALDNVGGFGLCGSNSSTPTINGTVITPVYPDTTTAAAIKADLNAAFLSMTPPAGPPAAGSLGGAINLPAGTTLGNVSGSALVQGDNYFVAGVYQSLTSILITDDLTLDAQGNPDAVFIFQSSSSLTTADGAPTPGTHTRIILVNGAKASNVWWQVGSSATLGTNSEFFGNILAAFDITMKTHATACGRSMAGAWVGGSGAFVFDSNVVSVPGNPSAPLGCE